MRSLSCVTLLVLFVLYGCALSPHQKKLQKLDMAKEALIEDLKSIRCREHFAKMQEKLEKDFESFTEMLIQCSEISESQKNLTEFLKRSEPLNEQLENEFYRVMALEGGREVLSIAQETSLRKLNNLEIH